MRKASLSLHDRPADRGADVVAFLAVLVLVALDHQGAGGGDQARRRGDVADGAAFGRAAIEGALRSLQHLDPLEVEQQRAGAPLFCWMPVLARLARAVSSR